MIINEDYFEDLDITEDEIIKDDSEEPLAFLYDNPKVLSDYLTSKYKNCLIIYTPKRPNIYNDLILWNFTLPDLIKRVQYTLDVYNVDYEKQVIIRDSSDDNADMRLYDFKGYKICSSCKTEKDMYSYSNDFSHRIYIVIYVNLPDFSYRQSYNFINSLQKAIWKSNKEIEQLEAFEISKRVYSLYDFNSYDPNTLKITITNCEVQKIIGDKIYKKFFLNTMYFFHKDQK